MGDDSGRGADLLGIGREVGVDIASGVTIADDEQHNRPARHDNFPDDSTRRQLLSQELEISPYVVGRHPRAPPYVPIIRTRYPV